MLTVKEFSTQTGISEHLIRRLCQAGKVPGAYIEDTGTVKRWILPEDAEITENMIEEAKKTPTIATQRMMDDPDLRDNEKRVKLLELEARQADAEVKKIESQMRLDKLRRSLEKEEKEESERERDKWAELATQALLKLAEPKQPQDFTPVMNAYSEAIKLVNSQIEALQKQIERARESNDPLAEIEKISRLRTAVKSLYPSRYEGGEEEGELKTLSVIERILSSPAINSLISVIPPILQGIVGIKQDVSQSSQLALTNTTQGGDMKDMNPETVKAMQMAQQRAEQIRLTIVNEAKRVASLPKEDRLSEWQSFSALVLSFYPEAESLANMKSGHALLFIKTSWPELANGYDEQIREFHEALCNYVKEGGEE